MEGDATTAEGLASVNTLGWVHFPAIFCPMEISRTTRRLVSILPAIVSIGLVAALLSRFEGAELLMSTDPALIIGAIIVGLAFIMVLSAIKLWWVAQSMGIAIPFARLWGLVAGLMPASFFAPFQSGHLLYVGAVRVAGDCTPVEALEVVAYDRWTSLIGTSALLVLGQMLLPEGHSLRHPLFLAGGLLGVGVFIFDEQALRLLGRFQWFRTRSRLLNHGIPRGRKLSLLALGAIYQSADAICLVLICRSLDLDVPLTLILGGYPIVLLLSYLPITVSGFGVRENMIVVLMAGVLTYDQAVGAGILLALLMYALPALVGIPWLPMTLRTLGRFRWRRDRNKMSVL
jgi:uncharacterized membrane protein YbhN (UPF0104 family)